MSSNQLIKNQSLDQSLDLRPETEEELKKRLAEELKQKRIREFNENYAKFKAQNMKKKDIEKIQFITDNWDNPEFIDRINGSEDLKEEVKRLLNLKKQLEESQKRKESEYDFENAMEEMANTFLFHP